MKGIFKYERFDGENRVDEVDKDIQDLIYGQSVVEVRHVDEYNIKLILSNGLVLHAMSNEGCGGCSNGWYEIDNILDLGVTGNVITKVEVESPEDAWWGTYKLFVYSRDKRMLETNFTGSTDDKGYYGCGIIIHVKSPDEDY